MVRLPVRVGWGDDDGWIRQPRLFFRTMLGNVRFDPATGSPLSDERHYPEHGTPCRVPKPGTHAPWDEAREGALTNGELVSDAMGLKGHFRESHRKALPEPEPRMDAAAALAIDRIKAEFESALDTFVWLCVAERLATKGYDTAWMREYCNIRCPHCRSAVKYRDGVWHLEAVCASAPSDHGCVDGDIRECVTEMYATVFGDSLDDPTVV